MKRAKTVVTMQKKLAIKEAKLLKIQAQWKRTRRRRRRRSLRTKVAAISNHMEGVTTAKADRMLEVKIGQKSS